VVVTTVPWRSRARKTKPLPTWRSPGPPGLSNGCRFAGQIELTFVCIIREQRFAALGVKLPCLREKIPCFALGNFLANPLVSAGPGMGDRFNIGEIPSIFPVIREFDNGEQFAADCQHSHPVRRVGAYDCSPLPLEVTALGCSPDEEPPAEEWRRASPSEAAKRPQGSSAARSPVLSRSRFCPGDPCFAASPSRRRTRSIVQEGYSSALPFVLLPIQRCQHGGFAAPCNALAL
jgi:hypothetical protein